LLGLVTDVQHKISRQGNKYGNFVIEDYSGKTEIILWSDDYAKFSPFLLQGSTVFVTGFFRQRFNRPEFEFKVNSVSMAETLKRNLTKQVHIEINPKDITKDVLSFVEKNVRNNPGKSTLKFTLNEAKNNLKISLLTMDNGFEMNDEMSEFLENNPEFDVQVTTV
jgi:DNA polymerase-3 subunit alpha